MCNKINNQSRIILDPCFSNFTFIILFDGTPLTIFEDTFGLQMAIKKPD